MNRLRYIAIRGIQTVFIVWLALSAVFFLFRLVPGDFADIMLIQGASDETVRAFYERWGLNDPLYVQYLRYMGNFITLDLGRSIQMGVPVIDLVSRRLFNTFILVAPAVTFTYFLGAGIGTVMGTKRGSRIERFGLIPIILGSANPIFIIGIILVAIFTSWLGWLPSGSMVSPETTMRYIDSPYWRRFLTVDFALHYLLPFSAIVIRYLYLPTLIMRTSVVEIRNQPFFFYHRMTGLHPIRRYRHLAKHASLPLITMYPITMTRAIGGLILLEFVFNWPGIGLTLLSSVLARDYPVVQFIIFLIAAFIIVSNFVVDIVYSEIDPRITLGG